MLAWHVHTTAASPGRADDQAAAAQSATLCEPKRRIGFLFAEPFPGRAMAISDLAEKIKKNTHRIDKTKKGFNRSGASSISFLARDEWNRSTKLLVHEWRLKLHCAEWPAGA
jgi:hypothetical protein